MRFATLILIAVLAGCSVTPEQRAEWAAEKQKLEEGVPKCTTAADCERMWAAARTFIMQRCVAKIDTATDSMMQTAFTPDGSGCTVTKNPLAESGHYEIRFVFRCAALYGCSPSPDDLWQSFNDTVIRSVSGAAPPP